MASATITLQAPSGAGLVINEIDYDNVGTDTAEFIELYNGGSAAVPLSGLSLVFVNGANNTVYTTVDLGPAGTIMPGQYLVVGATAVVLDAARGRAQIDAGAVTNYIQNGSPDGMALVNTEHRAAGRRALVRGRHHRGDHHRLRRPGEPGRGHRAPDVGGRQQHRAGLAVPAPERHRHQRRRDATGSSAARSTPGAANAP